MCQGKLPGLLFSTKQPFRQSFSTIASRSAIKQGSELVVILKTTQELGLTLPWVFFSPSA